MFFSRICTFLMAVSMPVMLSAQWKKTTLSGNKDLYDVQILGATAFIAGLNSALYKSTDSGKTWNSLTLSTPGNLRALFFTSPDTGFVCGENARIQKTVNGGASWTQKYVRTAAYAYDIAFSGRNGLAVGKDMLAVSSRDLGETWSVDSTLKSGKKLNSVCILPDGSCWAVGDSGYMLKKHISDQRWVAVKYPTKTDLNHIRNIGDSVLIVCGGMPDSTQAGKYSNILLISRDGGNTWTQNAIPEMKTIYCSWFSSPDSGFLAGSNGLICKVYEPSTERGLQFPGTASALNSISFQNGTGLAVGDGGVVFRTRNGGGFGLSALPLAISELSLFPNPGTGHLSIRSTLKISSVALHDAAGRPLPFEWNEARQLLTTEACGILLISVTLDNGSVYAGCISIQR
jgi:photosystem II stability/assembly factor-like uncharacterized protein